ncbi:hypothetical protein Tco_1411196 [Tanacetum coccineum]
MEWIALHHLFCSSLPLKIDFCGLGIDTPYLLNGYDVLVVRIVIFKMSSFKLQNARLLLSFTKDATGYEYGLSSSDGWINYYSSIRCAPFEALYGRKYRSPVLWAEIGESRRKLLEFEVEDQVLLKVSPWKVYLMCFNLKKYLADANLHVHLKEIKVDKTLRFVEEPVEIIDRELSLEVLSKVGYIGLLADFSAPSNVLRYLYSRVGEHHEDLKNKRFIMDVLHVLDLEDSTVTYTKRTHVYGPEKPEQAPPSPDFVLEPVYLESMIPEDEVLPAEE